MESAHEKRPTLKYGSLQAKSVADFNIPSSREHVKKLRWHSRKPLPWLRQFDYRDHDAGDGPPAGIKIIARDEGDPPRIWGIDRSRPEDSPESWHVPRLAVLPDLANGRPHEYVLSVERYREALEGFGAPRLSALLRADANIPAPVDDVLIDDLEFAKLAGQLHAGNLAMIQLLHWTGEHRPDDRESIEARVVDFCWMGR